MKNVQWHYNRNSSHRRAATCLVADDVVSCWSCGDLESRTFLDARGSCRSCHEEGEGGKRLLFHADEVFTTLFNHQRGCCAICSETTGLFVDHDWITGLVRGLLCGSCNGRLGRYGDSTVNLRRAGHKAAADYVMTPPTARLHIVSKYPSSSLRKLNNRKKAS